MRRTWMIGALVAAVAILAAACDTADSTTTTAVVTTTIDAEEETTTTGTEERDDELSGLILDAQAQAMALADDIAAMAEAPELQEAWSDLVANVETLAADAASGDGDAIRDGLDEVGTIVDDLETDADLRSAWEEFRASMEEILAEFQM